MAAAPKQADSVSRWRYKARRVIVAPSLLSADFADLKTELKRCQRAKCLWIHLDIMDGHFVPNLTIGPPVVRSLRKVSKRFFFDCHLMIEHPLKYAPEFAEAGADLITIHQEAVHNVPNALSRLKKLNVMAGLSIKPKTSVAQIEPYLDQIDLALVMTVEPGFGGQEMIPATLSKVRRLALLREERRLNFHIQVDGGINNQTSSLAACAGANVLVSGSYLFRSKNLEQGVERMVSSIDPCLNGHGVQP